VTSSLSFIRQTVYLVLEINHEELHPTHKQRLQFTPIFRNVTPIATI